MKLYIPTCTLNFNSILASESISPRRAYHQRNFGNKRYYSVDANNLDGVILLYSKYPCFSVDDRDMENYPLVIEIDTDDYPKNTFVKNQENRGVDIYTTSKTIYFNPFHSFFYFSSFSELQGALSKAEQSLETKFARRYSKNFLVKQLENKGFFNNLYDSFFSNEDTIDFIWKPEFLNGVQNVDDYNVDEDTRIDRLKGFIYCYLIGANLSVDPNVAQLKALARRMRNTLSAIVNSPERRPTQILDDSLTTDIKSFNLIYSKVEPDIIYNDKLYASRLENDPSGLNKEDIIDLLKRLNLYESFERSLPLKKVYNGFELWDCVYNYTPELYERTVERLANVVKRQERLSVSSRQNVLLTEVIKLSDNGEIQIVDKSFKPSFYQSLVISQTKDEYLSLKNVMELSDNALALALNGGKILKSIMTEQWEGTPVSKYINALLSHLQESSRFDLFSLENEVLISFAAFCQKGDNIDRLVEYLAAQGISNYKLAYGLYGATFGFASLPKTFTSSLIDGNDEYFVNIHQSIWELLFDKKIQNATLPTSKVDPAKLSRSGIGNLIIDNISSVEKNPSKQTQVLEAVSKAVGLEEEVQSPKAFMYIFDSLPNAKRTKAYKALDVARFVDDKGQYTPESFKRRIYDIVGKDALSAKKKIDKAIELESKRQDPEAFLKILDNYLKPSDMSYRKIANLLNHSTVIPSKLNGVQPTQQARDIISNKESENKNSLPLSPTSIFFVDDMNVKNYFLVVKYLPEDLRKILSKKVTKFQEGYAANGRYASKPEDNPKDNDSTLDHFKRWCFYDKGSWPPIVKATPENRQLFEKLIMDLHIRYGDR